MESLLASTLRTGLFHDGDRPTIRSARLRGGLQADAVHLVTASGRDARGRRIVCRYVRKVVQGIPSREAAIYEGVLHRDVPSLAPRLLHASRANEAAILCLEHIEMTRSWPWADLETSAAVLERIARLHELRAPRDLPRWDYDAELSANAGWTLSAARKVASTPGRELVRDAMPMLEDVVSKLPMMRAHLKTTRPFAGRIIHGDLHPGNVLYRNEGGVREPVFVDWARTRIGSALEDVSAWLQSVSTWEPEMRRRHDTLFTRYLVARQLAPRLTTEVRDLYWFAAASNALAGALAFHLDVVAEQRPYDPASPSAHSARVWLRTLRQARARLQHSRT